MGRIPAGMNERGGEDIMVSLAKRMAGAAAGIGLAVSVLAAASAQAAGVTDSEILIGTHLDLSGPVAAGMPQLRNGTQMRFDEANEAGGVNGRKIKFLVEDNGSQPQMAVRAAEKLVKSDGIFAMVNPFGSGTNAAAVKRTVDGGAIYFSPWGASAVLHKISGDSPLLFTTIPNYDTTMAMALSWMIDKYKLTKIGFIYQEGPFGDLLGAGVKEAMAAHKLELAAQASYKPGDIEFSSQVARMKEAGVELIVCATITRETVGVATEIKKIGWTGVKMLTGAPGRTVLVSQLAKDAGEGMYGVGGWHSIIASDAPDPIKTWGDSYKRRFNLDPDENALLAYAYADWFVRAAQSAGKDLTTDSMVKAVAATTSNHPVFYTEEMFEKGHISPEATKVEQIQGGKWVPVSDLLH